MYEEINYFNYNIENGPFGICLSGISYCDGSYQIKRNKSPISVIEYVQKGTGTVIVDGKRFTASKGDVYILPAGTNHEYFSSADDPWIKTFFNIKGPLFVDLLRNYSLDDLYVINNCNVKESFDKIYKFSCSNCDFNDEFYNKIAIMMHQLLIDIKQIVASNGQNGQNDELLNIKRYIDKNTDRIIGNDELSKKFYRSNDYIIKAFNRRFGKTPYEYQIQQKIKAAKQLLLHTSLSIGEISKKLGYSNQHYFSALFKEKCELSPLQYRKAKK